MISKVKISRLLPLSLLYLPKSPSLIKNKEKILNIPKLKSEVNTRKIELPTITHKESHKRSQLDFLKVWLSLFALFWAVVFLCLMRTLMSI